MSEMQNHYTPSQSWTPPTPDEETLMTAKRQSIALGKLMSYYKCALTILESKFNVLNEEYAFETERAPISNIKTRLKTLPSITSKLERKGLPVTLENIEAKLHDVAGIRVICSFPEDVYQMADAFLKQDDITLLEKKDYIAHPKESGYRSLHLIVSLPVFLSKEKRMVTVEVQLRTIAMDFWASLEHQMRYKKDVDFTQEMADELFQCAKVSAELDQRMDRLRKKIAVKKKSQPIGQ